jgi:hypothetical protein
MNYDDIQQHFDELISGLSQAHDAAESLTYNEDIELGFRPNEILTLIDDAVTARENAQSIVTTVRVLKTITYHVNVKHKRDEAAYAIEAVAEQYIDDQDPVSDDMSFESEFVDEQSVSYGYDAEVE